ncbi:hypothetical protein [Glutamicibacter sp. NPDC087344]|uniref:hypothetical protein n=1 Tax=Glutamicibacter sp. NPDC087344 TaxID=3363994 RepID=UPI00381267F3
MVDGLALQDHVRRWDLDVPATQSLSRLNDVHPSDAIQQIDRLLGVIPHQYGERAWLLFCPLCADEGCGGLTTELTIQSETVSWSNFGWDINYEPDEKPIRTHSSSASTFERRDYEAVLGEARERFSQLL